MSIKVNGLCFSYGEKSVLQDVSFTAERGEFLSILGPNGAGKVRCFAAFWDCCRDIPEKY